MAGGKKFNLTELLNERSMEQAAEKDLPDMQEHPAVGYRGQKEQVIMVDVQDLIPSKENFYRVDDSLKRSIELAGVLQPLLVNRQRMGNISSLQAIGSVWRCLPFWKKGKRNFGMSHASIREKMYGTGWQLSWQTVSGKRRTGNG